jgi:FkbM family methyltransferase
MLRSPLMQHDETLHNLDPLDIVLFHVGGVGGYGPVKKVIDRFPTRTVVVCFEANPSEKDQLIQSRYRARGVRTLFVPKCIGAVRGKQQFYINKHPASSSIFPPSPELVDNHIIGLPKGLHTWGENCEVDRIVEFDTVTLDELVQDHTLPSPDILSMDIQGSEMPVMRGGVHALKDMLSIVSEVDFMELYEGQETFPDQHAFLAEHGFRIADILNTQYWHPGPAAGLGFLTMGEAVYFRKIQNSSLSLPKLIKLAAIATAFDRISYASKVVGFALEKFGGEAERLMAADKNFAPILEQYRYMKNYQGEYAKDIQFFYRRSLWQKIGDAARKCIRIIRRNLGALRQFIRQEFKALSGGVRN